MKSLFILLVICSQLLFGGAASLMKNKGLARHKARKVRKMCKSGEVDCTNVETVLTTITDMVSRETVSKSEFTFRQRVHFTEQVIVELTHLSEYYELRQLQQNYELNIQKDHVYFWNVFIKTMQKQYEIRTQELISTYFITSVIFAMRLQVFTSIRMVSMIHNFEYSLMSNNFAYDVFSVTKSFFQITVDYFRLVQVDRLFAKGVLFQMSEQIAHAQFNLQFQKDLGKQEQESNLQTLNSIWVSYESEVLSETRTYEQQFAQLVLVQKIQYQYEQYAKDQSKALSKNGMKAIAGHLSDLSFRDNKLFVNYVETRVQPQMMDAGVYQQLHTQAYKSRSFNVLEEANTIANFAAMESFTKALLHKDVKNFPFTDATFFKQSQMTDLKSRQSMHQYTKEQVVKIHGSNPFIKGYLGLDNGAVQMVHMSLDTIYSFLHGVKKQKIFEEQIGELINFCTDADTTENVYNNVMGALVSLKSGYDNYINWAYQFWQVHNQMKEEVERTFEYTELMNLLDKRIVPMQDKLNKRLKLHQAQLFNDFLSLLVEVRNYNKLQETAIKHMPESYVTKTPAEQNAMLLGYLNKHYQADFQKFYARFQYKLNSFFLTQNNLIACIKTFSSMLSDQLIKIYYVLEKKVFPYFVSPNDKSKDDKKRLMKKYMKKKNLLKRFSKRLVADTVFLEVSESRRKKEEDQKPQKEDQALGAVPKDFRVDVILNKERLTIYYQKIEASAFYKQQILFTRVRLYNNLLMKFMLKKYTTTSMSQQKLVGSPFEDYEKNFSDGLVTRSALFRVDGMLRGANMVETEQYGERAAFLRLMEKHKCALIRIYTHFQLRLKEYYISTKLAVDINYQEFILRVRQSFYLYVSDLEVVVVDETENYYNTVNQLKIMGYDEITFPSYSGKNPLLAQLVKYRSQMQTMNANVQIRVFYCQGCYNRILTQVDLYSYSDFSYEQLITNVKTSITSRTTETGLSYYYEINIVSFEQSNVSQQVFYIVKVYERVSAFEIVISQTEHRQSYKIDTITTSTDIMTSRETTSRTVQQVTINANCVLDYYFSTSKTFSIFDQVITRSEHVTETYNVQTVITTIDVDSVEFQNQRTAVHSFFSDTQISYLSEEYKKFVQIYDESSFTFSEKITKQDNTVELDFNSYFRYYVYIPRKMIYQDYLLLAQFEWFVHEFKVNLQIHAVVSISNYVTVYDLACNCRQFTRPDCFFEKSKLAALRDYKMENEVTKKFTSKQFVSFNRKFFGNNEWKIGQTSSWGKMFSKISNLVIDMSQESFSVTGGQLDKRSISTWNDYLDILSMEEAVKQSSVDQGLNLIPLGIYDPVQDAATHLEVTMLKVTDKHLRFSAMEFPDYEDDLRFSVVVNQMKLAFMFPHKLVPENILDNGIALRGEATEAKRTALQDTMNTIYADNDMYVIYIGRMDEVIENKEYLRVFVDATGDCVGHRAETVAKEKLYMYNDVIDPEYVVTEVFYYFEQERQQQYIQDLLAVNYNDPFYKTLYALGFRPVVSVDGDSYSIYGFYDFTVTYNENVKDQCDGQSQGGEESGSSWMYKRPSRGMKRIWVRPMQYCQDTPSSHDLYCNPKTGKSSKGEEGSKTVVQKAHASFLTQYASLTGVFKQNQQVNPYFIRKTYGNEVSTVTKILKNTGGTGRDVTSESTSDVDVQPEKVDIAGQSANNDFIVTVQPYYRFVDAGMTGQIEYFADRPMMAYTGQESKASFYKNVQSERSKYYHFHEYSEKTSTQQQKFQQSNYNAFSYVSARDEKAQKCFGGSEHDVPMDVYVREIQKMYKKIISKQVSVTGDCYNPGYSYIAYSYENVIQTLLEFKANMCAPKRLRKTKAHKKKHKKRRLHKKTTHNQ